MDITDFDKEYFVHHVMHDTYLYSKICLERLKNPNEVDRILEQMITNLATRDQLPLGSIVPYVKTDKILYYFRLMIKQELNNISIFNIANWVNKYMMTNVAPTMIEEFLQAYKHCNPKHKLRCIPFRYKDIELSKYTNPITCKDIRDALRVQDMIN